MAKRKRIINDPRQFRFLVSPIMRYETLGDYQEPGTIIVYAKLDAVERLAVAIHELIEFNLLHLQGIREPEIFAWDMNSKNPGTHNEGMYDKNPRYRAAHKYAETAKVAVRHVRRDGMDLLKKLEKDHTISQDDHKRMDTEVQKATDQSIADIDQMLATKEKEIMTV